MTGTNPRHWRKEDTVSKISLCLTAIHWACVHAFGADRGAAVYAKLEAVVLAEAAPE